MDWWRIHPGQKIWSESLRVTLKADLSLNLRSNKIEMFW
jgi:hypothetical protein